MKLTKAIDDFIFSKSADGLSPNTLAIYRWGLDKLVAYLGDVELETITKPDLQRWLIWLREEYKPTGIRARERLSPASLQDAWRALKSFYAWAKHDLDLPRVDDIKRPPGESPPIIPFTEDEVRALLKAADHFSYSRDGIEVTSKRHMALRNVAIILVLLDTGMRVGELTRLTASDVNTMTGEIVIQPFGSGIKTHGRVVFLGKAAKKAVFRYKAERDVQPGDALFTLDTGGIMSATSVLQLLNSIGRTAGVSHVHPHRFRHTFAVQALRNGMNVFVLRKLLGHKSLEMVKRYVHLVHEDSEAAMQTASPVDRWHL